MTANPPKKYKTISISPDVYRALRLHLAQMAAIPTLMDFVTAAIREKIERDKTTPSRLG